MLLAGQEGLCKPSWAAPRWRKDLIRQKCFQFQLQVIHLFAQVPINSGQNFLQFSSKPCTDLSAGCSRAVTLQLEWLISARVHFSSSYLQPPQFVKQACANLPKSSSQSPADPDPPHESLSLCLAQGADTQLFSGTNSWPRQGAFAQEHRWTNVNKCPQTVPSF